MKKLLLSLILILGISAAASSQSYNFSKTTGTYTELATPISLTNNLTWDDPVADIPLGFNFTILDTTISNLHFNDYFLGGTVMASDQSTGRAAFISVFEADLMDRGYDLIQGENQPGGLSELSYKIEGTAGSKICKIQWKNAGFYNEIIDNDTSLQYINCQLWLFEGSNNIEMHYGTSNITQDTLVYDNGNGPSIGIWPAINMDNFLLEGDGFGMNGTVPNETGAISYADTIPNIIGTPTNGTIYKFVFDATRIKDVNKLAEEISIWPQPAVNSINIKTNLVYNSAVLAIDVNGKSIQLIAEDNMIAIEKLPTGAYTLQFNIEGQLVNKRLVKL